MTPKDTTKQKWWSLGILVWISVVSASVTFSSVHPWGKALLFWWAVPWAAGMGYYCGWRGRHQRAREEENQPWLYQDLHEWLNGRQNYEITRSRIRLKFTFKEKE